ncbi:MAG: DUF2752 domain-containing protein [candidate division KSB1 bacterium]|nr:DUF2752 domain-containing protein [candidate division KSB1 bacterium]MDZ7364976.1 DUF2752 domain-containing protein [candidate division KSB1 bacterium]MDZ7403371.1 DUF2752 domain-containing protein [candidate division KSB1 bacterium]
MPVATANAGHDQTPNSVSRRLDAGLVILPLFLLGFLLARFATPVFALLPPCWFRTAFGLPCPSCGATRAALALVRGELLAALVYQPLFVIGLVVLSIWSLLRLFEIFSGKMLIEKFSTKIAVTTERREVNLRQRVRWLTIGAIMLNWLYLVISE